MEYSAAQSGASRGGLPGGSGGGAATRATPPTMTTAASEAKNQSAFRTLVMGSSGAGGGGGGASSSTTTMGLSDLRSRARELRRTLDELARVLASRPEALLWGDVLEKFCVAGVQASALSARCRAGASGMASAYSLHPSSVNELNAASLPVMLSTAPLPEAVAERAKRVEEAVEALVVGGGGSGGGGGEEAAKTTTKTTTLERLGAAADSVNALVDFLTVPSSSSAGVVGLLDPKSAERRSLAADAHALAAPPPPPPPRGLVVAKGNKPGATASAVPEDPREALVARALAGKLV